MTIEQLVAAFNNTKNDIEGACKSIDKLIRLPDAQTKSIIGAVTSFGLLLAAYEKEVKRVAASASNNEPA